MPNSTTNVSVNLEGIGQTSSLAESGGASSTSDPRANYEYIFASNQVVNRAAQLASLEPSQFGKPKLKSIENTTIIEVSVSGKTAKESQSKSLAYYKAMLERLSELRDGLIAQREEPTRNVLKKAQLRLSEAQSAVAKYQLESGLTSEDQVTQLYTNIEVLRLERSRAIANYSRYNSRLKALQSILGLNPNQAAQAFLLLSDQSFQNSSKAYGEASSELQVLRAKFGENNPKVLLQKSKLNSSAKAMTDRASLLIGKSSSSLSLPKIALNISQNGRDELFRSLINNDADSKGQMSQAISVTQQIEKLEKRLRKLTQLQVRLESLKREEKIAEAVFASTLAKIDLGQANQFTAFPLIQMAVRPEIPDKLSSPRYMLVILGSAFGSILILIGLGVLWIRKPWIQKASKWISS